MARACLKCKEYVLIFPENPSNIVLINEFEAKHRGHTLITLNFEEIKGTFKKYSKNEKSSEEQEN
ncbi:MAG: hypothetical protein ACQERB_04125 [Promethearchaeati archaeon]